MHLATLIATAKVIGDTTDGLVLVAAAGAAAAVIVKLVRGAWKIDRRLTGALAILDEVKAEFKPNGGSSLRDSVNRLEGGQERLEYGQADLRARSRLTIATMSVGFFAADPDGLCTYTSPEWLDLAGMSDGRAHGVGWLHAVHEDDRPSVRREWEEAIRDGRDFDLTYRFRAVNDGKTTPVRGRATAVRVDGVLRSYVGTVTPLTEPYTGQEPHTDRDAA